MYKIGDRFVFKQGLRRDYVYTVIRIKPCEHITSCTRTNKCDMFTADMITKEQEVYRICLTWAIDVGWACLL